jgi:hypothetical protein
MVDSQADRMLFISGAEPAVTALVPKKVVIVIGSNAENA